MVAANSPSSGGASTSSVVNRRSTSSGGVGCTSPNPASVTGSGRVPSQSGGSVDTRREATRWSTVGSTVGAVDGRCGDDWQPWSWWPQLR